jgi:CheY-like chemotaxis protein
MKKALIVDDDESTRLILQLFLETIPDLQVTLADGGDGTLELLGRHSYDVILLDLLMPGVGGIELLTRMRKSSTNKATPVIVISLMADPATRIACQSLGVAGYVVKPIQREALIRSVTAALGQ